MTDTADRAALEHLTETLHTAWVDRLRRGVGDDLRGHCAALAAAALGHLPPTPGPDDTRLPPYSGEETVCVKCSHDSAVTRFRKAGEHSTQDPHTFRPSTKGERLERECWRCDYAWDEALAPPTGPAPYDVTPEALARALEGAHDGWALDLSPECAEHMARSLLGVLDIRRRHDAPTEESYLEEPENADTPDTSAHTLTDPAHEGTTL